MWCNGKLCTQEKSKALNNFMCSVAEWRLLEPPKEEGAERGPCWGSPKVGEQRGWGVFLTNWSGILIKLGAKLPLYAFFSLTQRTWVSFPLILEGSSFFFNFEPNMSAYSGHSDPQIYPFTLKVQKSFGAVHLKTTKIILTTTNSSASTFFQNKELQNQIRIFLKLKTN